VHKLQRKQRTEGYLSRANVHHGAAVGPVTQLLHQLEEEEEEEEEEIFRETCIFLPFFFDIV